MLLLTTVLRSCGRHRVAKLFASLGRLDKKTRNDRVAKHYCYIAWDVSTKITLQHAHSLDGGFQVLCGDGVERHQLGKCARLNPW